MHGYLRQSTASQVRSIGPFCDDTDFKTLENALTIANTDILLKKNGAASAAKNSGGATADGSGGLYHLTFDATDTATVGELFFSVKVSGALVVFGSYVVLEEVVYDALFLAAAPGYLQPTTAGRTLDVSAGGEAGIDWANVGSPTTTLGLSGTTVKTATDVETDTVDLQARLPAALTGDGNIKADTLRVGGTLQTAGDLKASLTTIDDFVDTEIADIQARLPAALVGGRMDANLGAISTDATAADNAEAFFDGTGYAGTGNVIPTVTALTTAPADPAGVTTLLSRVSAARAGYFDTLQPLRTATAQAGASGSVTLDASASAIDDFYTHALVVIASGTGANQVRTIGGYTGATKVATVTPNWGTTPASDSVFLLLPAGVVAGATVPTAGEVADAVWDEAAAGHVSAGTFGKAAADILEDTGTTLQAEVDGIQADTEDLQARVPAALVSGRMDSSVGAMASGVLTATAIAADAITDAKVASDVTIASVTGAVGSVTGNVGGNVVGSVASVTAGVTLAASAVQAIWDAATSVLTTVGSIGKWLLDKLDVVVSTRLATSGYTVPPTAAANADAVWDETLADHLGAGSTGAGLNAAGSAGDPWNTALPGAYGAGTAGKKVGDNLDATISSRSSHSAADVWAAGTRTLTSFGTLVADVWASATRLLTAGTNIVLAKGVGLTGLNDLSAAQVNTEADTALVDVGLTSTVTGRVDVAVSSRLATAGYTAPLDAAGLRTAVGLAAANLDTQLTTIDDFLDTEVVAIKAKTDTIPASPAAAADIAAALDATIADSIPADGTRPSMRQALYMLTQFMLERSVSGTTMTINKPDGVTVLLTLTLDSATAPTSCTRAT